jgi:DNA gyrase subunit A
LQVKRIKVIGRNTQGVKLIKLDANDKGADVARVVSEEEDEE